VSFAWGLRRILAGMAALWLAAPCFAWAEACDASAGGLCNPAALSQTLGKLAAAKPGQPLHVMVLGDSHTAADLISGALRERLQAWLGAGGRGVLPPGAPYPGYAPQQVEVGQSGGWIIEPSLILKITPEHPAPAPPPFGLTGWRLSSDKEGASLTLDAQREAFFDRVVVCGLATANGGVLEATSWGEAPAKISFAAEAPGPVCRTLTLSQPRSHLQLTLAGGPVSLTSLAVFRGNTGAVLSNLGVVGAQLRDLAARDDRVMAAELAAYRPDVILLAFGTNEGFDRGLDGAAYDALIHQQLARLRRLSPGSEILVLGPPDADMVRPDIPEDGKANAGFDCAPLSDAERRDYAELTAGRSPRLKRWYPAPGLAVVRDAQAKAALDEGAAFWDWSARLGGACSAHRMAASDPRLVRGDHVHFTADGAPLVANRLADDLMAAAAALRTTNSGEPR
jgi:lysophospholipase L1-like esterase